MILKHQIRLATLADAEAIGEMSRDLIEHGLGWRWTPARIRHCLRDAATNVAVATAGDSERIAGFAIMRYKDDEAHLVLLGVDPSPVAALNRAVAIGERDGPGAGLAAIEEVADLPELEAYPYLHAARAVLLRRLGRDDEAAAADAVAATLPLNDATRSLLDPA